MRNRLFKKIFVLVVFIFLLSVFACGTAKTVSRASVDAINATADFIIPDEKPVLKKKVVIAPVINQSGIKMNLDEKMRQALISYLSQDEFLLINRSVKGSDETFNPRTLQYGIVIDPEQVTKAQEAGMNILVSCVFHPIESEIKRKGIWPFRKNRRIIDISISINAIDTTNNTFAVSKNESISLRTNEKDPDDTIEWEPDINLIEKGVHSVLEKLSDFTSEKLRQYPWQSRIYGSDNNTYIIKAGHDVDINQSTVFELYSKGESIKSATGDEYSTLGDKLGETGVISISRDESVLEITPDSEKNKKIEIIRAKR